MTLLGGIEAGGTKCVCAVGASPTGLLAEARIPTTTPGETLATIVAFFRAQEEQHGPVAAIGVGAFGPLDLHRLSPRYGHITTTPKPGWAGTDLVGPLQAAFDVPVGFDTDVNAAAIAEWSFGAAQGLETMLYLTVGTGIGGGAIVHGRPLHGLMHPEMGHVRIPHDRTTDPFDGLCPFHEDCLEGLASGPAMAARWERPAETLPEGHPGWTLEARYLALALHGFVCTLSPQRIVVGGGVVRAPHVLPLVRTALAGVLNDYVQAPEIMHGLDRYVVAPALGDRAGVIGALTLAQRARAGTA